MNVDLTDDQRARLELISIHTGKSPARVLIDAAQFLLNCDTGYYPPSQPFQSQQFLADDELEARLATLLRH